MIVYITSFQTQSSADPDTRVARQLVELPAQVRALYPRSRELGLDPAALQVLLCLWLEDGRTVGALAEQLALRPQSTSNALRQLQRAGLVTERPEPNDRRRRCQQLTRRGRRTAAQLIRSRRTLLQPEPV